MALVKKTNYKGIELKAQYIKANACWIDLSLFADIDARKSGQVLEGQTVRIPITEEVYALLKAQIDGAKDELDNAWYVEPVVEEAPVESPIVEEALAE